jgi:hypothetical protein
VREGLRIERLPERRTVEREDVDVVPGVLLFTAMEGDVPALHELAFTYWISPYR